MNKNIGNTDRLIRTVTGLALLAYAMWGTGEYTWVGWIGAVPLLTAAISWCPPYALLGINTCATKNVD